MAPSAGAVALHSSLCSIPPDKPSSPSKPNTLVAAKPKSLLQNHPLYVPNHAKLSLQFKEKVLCLEIMGVDAGKALSQNPDLRTATMESIHSIIYFLLSKGIQEKDLPRIFGMCPKILTSDIKTDLNPVFDFLFQDLNVPDYSFRKVINKCPRFLTSSVKDQLKPALLYLKRLGFKDLATLAYQDSVLLVSNVERTLVPKLKYLVNLGFSKEEARSMVLRHPPLFTFSIENNFQPKFEYFAGEMGRKLEELKEFPQYFAFSLENRIKPRHMEVLQSGINLPLSMMLKSTDEEFGELIKQVGG
ncbi:transcription termination factor MTEF1, chloroplastic [Gastrolobium bilobum]|uniref:transcription termination factor MTEF1, chloroplastic n=1 Tax=Gastrolobium bilobum TaxID=150636 RepID=UPI002AB1630C|nr:transcription termination factor MTEF1, chloroplastic [Gastrolobium bilobum]